MSNRAPSQQARRLRGLFSAIVIIALACAVRLIQFQIVQAPQINAESFARRSITTTLPAMRGNIVDANGKILATTVMAYDINVDPTMVAPFNTKVNGVDTTVTVDQAAQELAVILNMDPALVMQKLQGTSHYSQVAKQVDGATYLKIKNLDIPWVFPEPVPHRVYPNGALAGNLLGFIGSDGQPLEGLEVSQNKCLAGVDGKETYQRGVDGIKIPGSADVKVPPQNGGTLKLTIDSDLQYFAQQVMAKYVRNERADWGSAIVVEVKTGKILAAAEAPSVDPNNFTAVAAENRSSRIFRVTFEPGSTVKMVTAATAIDQGVATPLTHVVAPQSTTILNGFRISDSHQHPTEHLTLQGVLIESSNTGIIQIGIKVPYATRYHYWTNFGLGSRTAVNFPGEASGIIHETAPDGASVYTSMFGQAMTVTPMQSAFVYQTFANLGVRLSPQLLETCTAANGNVTPAQTVGKPVRVLKTSTAREVISMLENDVAQKGGVGSTAAIPGYRIGGKSGTAQIANPNGVGYGLLHAISFIGLAPAEDPKYVLAVTIYKPRTVSNSIGATPPFKAILEQVLRTYRVPPSTTKAPQIAAHW
jgi:cell division protein FtsI (penicillin-binding protein 3)